jgi:hypothetical protein
MLAADAAWGAARVTAEQARMATAAEIWARLGGTCSPRLHALSCHFSNIGLTGNNPRRQACAPPSGGQRPVGSEDLEDLPVRSGVAPPHIAEDIADRHGKVIRGVMAAVAAVHTAYATGDE